MTTSQLVHKLAQRVELIGKPVKVYWNSREGYFSIVDPSTRRVALRHTRVELRDVTFRVSARGRDRVVRTGVKNVHAWACGTLVSSGWQGWVPAHDWDVVNYNPHKGPTFYYSQSGAPITTAAHVVLQNGHCLVEPERGVSCSGALPSRTASVPPGRAS